MKPNVIVICMDTFRADMGGAGGDLSFVETPNLDRLRLESMSFTRCFGEGEPTIPVRRCMFTGKRSFPWRFDTPNEGLWPAGDGWHPIPHELDTLAERLADAGYFTGMVADTYHMFKPSMNFTRGFLSWELIRGQESDNWRGGPADSVDLAAHIPEDNPSPADYAVIFQYLLNMRGRQREEDWLAAKVFSQAANWLEENKSNGPFFLWVDSFSPHELWDPPRAYVDRYCPPAQGVKDFIHHSVLGNPPKATTDEIERTKALYFGFVTFVDRWYGHLLDAVDDLGLRDDTIVMFLSDHGTEVMDKGYFGKGGSRLYPYNTRLNLIVRHPDGPRGTTCDAWTQNQDLAPTILGMLGIEHEPLDGFDMWPVALGQAETVRDHVTTGWGEHACVRDDAFAVHLPVTDPGFATAARVFDVQKDPREEIDVALQHEEVIALAVRRLEDFAGPLPLTFTQYQQRHPARSIRTFAPRRYGQA